MKYTRISIKFDEYKDRFNRTILVKGDPDLFKFETFLAFILKSEFEHSYFIYTKNDEYVMSPFMLSDAFKKTKKYSGNYHLSDLPKNFEFLYDMGDEYLFKCRKEGIIEIDSRKEFILESAKGQGIWEDNIYSLCAYLSGEIKASKRTNDPQNGFFLPWNFENRTFGDFDKEIDIEEENERISKSFSSILSYFRKNEKEYIETYNISLEDIEPEENNFDKYRLKDEFEDEDVLNKKA